jgi:hypothetical protein
MKLSHVCHYMGQLFSASAPNLNHLQNQGDGECTS